MSPRFCLLRMVVVILVLVLTRPSFVHSRALLLADKSETGRLTVESLERASADSGGRRTVVRDQVFEMASGPSRKGSGH